MADFDFDVNDGEQIDVDVTDEDGPKLDFGDQGDAVTFDLETDDEVGMSDDTDEGILSSSDEGILPIDGSVTTKKLGELSVTTPKLADGAVTRPKIAEGAVTDDKLDPSGVIATVRRLDDTGSYPLPTQFDEGGAGTVYVPADLVASYKADALWKDYNIAAIEG